MQQLEVKDKNKLLNTYSVLYGKCAAACR